MLNIVTGALRTPQKYTVQPTAQQARSASIRVEWGINLKETIDIQNGNLNLLPPPTPPTALVPRYVYSGRALAEVVHNDPSFQFFYQAAAILGSLGVKPNPGWPVYLNQGSFVTLNGGADIFNCVADVSQYALIHTWYWKWQHYRKLRPEVFALWINDVKNGLVPNKNNFDIADFIFSNKVLDDIYIQNNLWIPNANSYTLPQTYREGSPTHPAYNSGHAIIAGACVTLLKIFYDGEQLWSTVPGVISGALSGIPNAVVQADAAGINLVAYNGDITNITVGGELNKLADNDGTGRDFAGIHYRSDIQTALLLGEEVAIHYIQDMLCTMVENNIDGSYPSITFRKFNGCLTTVKPTLCLKNR